MVRDIHTTLYTYVIFKTPCLPSHYSDTNSRMIRFLQAFFSIMIPRMEIRKSKFNSLVNICVCVICMHGVHMHASVCAYKTWRSLCDHAGQLRQTCNLSSRLLQSSLSFEAGNSHAFPNRGKELKMRILTLFLKVCLTPSLEHILCTKFTRSKFGNWPFKPSIFTSMWPIFSAWSSKFMAACQSKWICIKNMCLTFYKWLSTCGPHNIWESWLILLLPYSGIKLQEIQIKSKLG